MFIATTYDISRKRRSDAEDLIVLPRIRSVGEFPEKRDNIRKILSERNAGKTS